jgi:hypothetical protein
MALRGASTRRTCRFVRTVTVSACMSAVGFSTRICGHMTGQRPQGIWQRPAVRRRGGTPVVRDRRISNRFDPRAGGRVCPAQLRPSGGLTCAATGERARSADDLVRPWDMGEISLSLPTSACDGRTWVPAQQLRCQNRSARRRDHDLHHREAGRNDLTDSSAYAREPRFGEAYAARARLGPAGFHRRRRTATHHRAQRALSRAM